MDAEVYRQTGQIVLLPSATGLAGHYASLNSGYLTNRRIYPHITGITVDQERRAVFVQMAANADELVPLLGRLTLRGQGKAQVRGMHRTWTGQVAYVTGPIRLCIEEPAEAAPIRASIVGMNSNPSQDVFTGKSTTALHLWTNEDGL